MAIPTVSGSVTYPRDPSLFERDHNRFLRIANVAGADLHHRIHIRRHFEPYAAAKYGYAPRSPRYLRQKQRRYGYRPDLVYTGRSRDVMTTQRQITATPKGARLILTFPFKGGSGRLLDGKALRRMKKTLNANQINAQEQIRHRIAEMEAITPDEQAAVNREIETVYVELTRTTGVMRRKRF